MASNRVARRPRRPRRISRRERYVEAIQDADGPLGQLAVMFDWLRAEMVMYARQNQGDMGPARAVLPGLFDQASRLNDANVAGERLALPGDLDRARTLAPVQEAV